MRSRMLAVGLTAIVAGAIVGAAPAYAQDGADLGIELTGTTVAEGAASKFGTLTVTNDGPNAATGAILTYDASGLDTSKVTLVLEGCPLDGTDTVDCHIVNDHGDPAEILVGENVTFFDLFEVTPGATGDAGVITVTIRHAGTDPNEFNDSVTVPVAIGESGPDLLVFAPDVYHEATVDHDTFAYEILDTPVMPGSEAIVHVFVENQGTEGVPGIDVAITLPEHVTFTLPEPECSHAAGDSETTCTYPSLGLLPASDGDPEGPCLFNENSCGWLFFPVEISEDAPAEALTGGIAEVFGVAAQLFTAPEETEPEEPRNTSSMDRPDVDPTDNVSGFTVFVSDEPGGSGGGDDGLPVTGVPAALLGAGGAAVLVVGLALFLFTRKRRVVMQTPADGSTE